MMRISLDSPALIAVRNLLAGSATRQPQRPGRKASRTQLRPEQLEPRMMLDAGMSAVLPGVVRAGSPTAGAAAAVSSTLVAGTPRVGSPAASDGRVTGAAVFVNSGGGTVNHVGPVVSAGGGSVSVNATGAFIYQPTLAQRRAATPATTDTFTVTASNGRDSAAQTITVRVDPGRLVAVAPTAGTPNAATGVVSGSSGLSDSVGRTVLFTVSGVPTFRTANGTSVALASRNPSGGLSSTGISAGGGAVSVDATGAFLYTPTPTQRRAAVAGSTDTFWVTANNTQGLRTQQITVLIDPGTPVAGATTPGTPDTGTGAVTGTAVFTDTAGRTLTYSTTGSSAGGGTISVNPSTGAFTYTPTPAQRQAATGSTTDTFTVTASNGVRSTTQTVTVAVDPGTPVAGTPTVNSATVGSKTYNSTYVAASPSTTIVFTNTSLHEVIGISGNLGGAWVAGGAATPYHYTSNGTTAFVQLQIVDSTFVKMVKVRLSQSGSNLVATVMYAKYAAVAYLGSNFDTLGGTTGVPIATSGSGAGYGVSRLTVTTKVVTGSAAFTDSAERTLTYSAPATSTGGGKVTINTTTGAFTFVPTTAQRQSAGTTPTDTFTVTADNGVRTATQTITVPVS